jgi:histidinol-phosphatase
VYEDELAFANDLADEAGAIAMSFFGGEFDVRLKPDLSPVTEADLAVEATIRERLAERFPDDAVLGEEQGLAGSAERVWVIDPIDGTKNFSDGVQVWANLIALLDGGEPVVGVVNAPALGERYDAAKGGGARLNGEPIHVSSADRVGRAFVLYAELPDLLDGPHAEAFLDLVRSARRDRGFGDFWGHMLVARGAADVMLEPELATWDWAALAVVVREAGGRMTAFDGGPLVHDGSVVATNGVLHDEIVARLSSPPRPS